MASAVAAGATAATAGFVSPANAFKPASVACSPQLCISTKLRSNSSKQRVRSGIICSASKNENPTPMPEPLEAAAKAVVEPAVEATKPTTKAMSTSFWDLFAFSGPVPETVNGRLAMLGFTAALAMEVASGQDLFGQIENGGVSWFAAAALLFTLASLVPFSRGISTEKAQGGIGGVFSSKAERWNGRAAMLGLVALAVTEIVKGSPLV